MPPYDTFHQDTVLVLRSRDLLVLCMRKSSDLSGHMSEGPERFRLVCVITFIRFFVFINWCNLACLSIHVYNKLEDAAPGINVPASQKGVIF